MRIRCAASRLLAAVALLATAADLHAGSYELASMLRISDIIPGTERVRLLPDGGLEEGGTKAGWHKKGGRWGLWTVGPHVAPAPGVCGQMAVYLDAVTASGSHQIDGLPPYQSDWLQTFSLYAWLLGPQQAGMAPGVPGEQHICFSRSMVPGPDPEPYAEGAYIFGDFKPKSYQIRPDDKVSYNIKGGCEPPDPTPGRWGFRDSKGEWRSVILAGDNMADTRILDFAPPLLRYAAAADFAELARLESDSRAPGEARPHRVRAADAAARFARDLADDACKTALAEWQLALQADPDQPLVRCWIDSFRGYVPAEPFTPNTPPADLPPAPAGPALGRRLELASYIRLRDILPGTERVHLAPGGDFEKPDAWSAPAAASPLVVGAVVDLKTRLPDVALFWDGVLFGSAGAAGSTAEVRSAPLRLEPGRYVISAYLAPLGEGDDDQTSSLGAVSIGLEGAPAVWWGWPRRHAWTAQEGLFIFAAVTLDGPRRDRAVCITVGPRLGSKNVATARAPDGQTRPVDLLLDNVAITPADEFRPPVLRGRAHFEFSALANRPADPGPTDSAGSPADLNRLAADCMVEFLRDPARADLHAQALRHWTASLAANPDQPLVQHFVRLWSGYKAVPGAAAHPFRVER